MNELIGRLTGISAKVLAAVPMQETWNSSDIIRELFRTGTRTELKVVDGCLDGLIHDGLVKEPERGYFTRVQTFKEPKVANAFKPPAPVEPAQHSLMDRIGAVASELRNTADQLDEIALLVDEQLLKASAGSAKLVQLQELLRGMV